MKQVRHQNGQGGNNTNNGGSIYQVTAPRNTFRPVSPYGHHIYMEIDPVYQQHLMNQQAQQQQQLHMVESSEGGHSDIQLSDISDDDLRRFSDGRARYAEERPLIRNTNANNHSMNVDQHPFSHRQFMTSQRSQL